MTNSKQVCHILHKNKSTPQTPSSQRLHSVTSPPPAPTPWGCCLCCQRSCYGFRAGRQGWSIDRAVWTGWVRLTSWASWWRCVEQLPYGLVIVHLWCSCLLMLLYGGYANVNILFLCATVLRSFDLTFTVDKIFQWWSGVCRKVIHPDPELALFGCSETALTYPFEEQSALMLGMIAAKKMILTD